MTPDEEARLRELIREEMRTAMKEHSESLGIDSKEKIEWQRRFAYLDGLYIASQEDVGWLKKGVRTVAIPATILALWEGIKHYMRQ